MDLSCVCWMLFLCAISVVKAGDTFIAAVVEPVTSEVLSSINKESALKVINKNLNHFEELIQTASQQKARIIVFPEYGITGFGQTRNTAPYFGEKVPNPYMSSVIPCTNVQFNNTTILKKLSCLAIKNNIIIVANVISVEPCQVDAPCPPDGQFIYNTDVAFASNGQLVARYHKMKVYADEKEIFDSGFGLDNYGVFKTDFGTIGLFTCFDILFPYPAIDLVYGVGVDIMAFPTAWMNELPLLSAVEYQEAWAIHYNTTLLASNQHLPIVKMTGSGIYNGQIGALTYHYDMVTYRSKLLIVDVPNHRSTNIVPEVRNKIISELKAMDKHSLERVSPVLRALLDEDNQQQQEDNQQQQKYMNGDHNKFLQNDGTKNNQKTTHQDNTTFQGILNDDMYTFQPLTGASGQISICNGTICCHLDFTRREKSSYELYALGAFDGLHTHNGQYYLQTCSLVRCQVNEGTKCGGEIETATEIFQNISLGITGYNSKVHLFPEIVTNKVNLAVIGKEWISEFPYDHIRTVENGIENPLLAANIYGRWYEKDSI
ncbi:pantetheinase-like [Antedon mediterranea]|uniref:pantetheinase-like n=1 Tax=Antedon mediterranea TaxID=105859 RepID=UPI003AF8F42D